MVEAIHVDVLNAFLGQKLAEGSKRAVLDVEPLPDFPELDLRELRQRRGPRRRGMVVAHRLVSESEDGPVVGNLRPWVLTLAKQVVQTLLEGRDDVGFGLAHLICGGFHGLHVTPSQPRLIPAARMNPPMPRMLAGLQAPAVRDASRSGDQPCGSLRRSVPGPNAADRHEANSREPPQRCLRWIARTPRRRSARSLRRRAGCGGCATCAPSFCQPPPRPLPPHATPT